MDIGKYVVEKFSPAVTLFNYIAGVHVDCINTLDEAIEKTLLHLKVTHEEYIELVSNIGFDKTEELDGAVDLLFTYPYLCNLIAELSEKFEGYAELLARHKEMRGFMLMESCMQTVQTIMDAYIPVDVFIEACDRVIDNNMSKFTTDKEYAESWELPEGCYLVNKQYQDDIYYYIVNNDGKVKKRIGFVGVDLSDLAEKLSDESGLVIGGQNDQEGD